MLNKLMILIFALYATCSFAISPGAGQAQIQNNLQEIQKNQQRMQQMKQNQHQIQQQKTQQHYRNQQQNRY